MAIRFKVLLACGKGNCDHCESDLLKFITEKLREVVKDRQIGITKVYLEWLLVEFSLILTCHICCRKVISDFEDLAPDSWFFDWSGFESVLCLPGEIVDRCSDDIDSETLVSLASALLVMCSGYEYIGCSENRRPSFDCRLITGGLHALPPSKN